MVAGTGNAVMVAGTGPDLFIFVNGKTGGSDTIWNFVPGTDKVLLSNYAPDVVQTALAGAVTAGGSTTITLSDNTRITFGGVAQLTPSFFA
jgi:Ca2+-binding RTX toxin-like protein